MNSRLASSTSSLSCLWACVSQGCGEAEGVKARPPYPLPRLPAAPQPPAPQRGVHKSQGTLGVRTRTRDSEQIHPLPTDEMGEAGEARLPCLLAPTHLCDCLSPGPAHWEAPSGFRLFLCAAKRGSSVAPALRSTGDSQTGPCWFLGART